MKCEQNREMWTTQNLELFDKKLIMLTIFDIVGTILKEVSVSETNVCELWIKRLAIFHYSKIMLVWHV